MPNEYFGIIELGLTAIFVLGFGIWQIRSVNRAQAEIKAKQEREAKESEDADSCG